MIVEDDAAGRLILEHTLRDCGLDVVSIEDGDAAVEVIAAVEPDLVVLDVDLPTEDGFSICRRLRGKPESGSLPVLLVTDSWAALSG